MTAATRSNLHYDARYVNGVGVHARHPVVVVRTFHWHRYRHSPVRLFAGGQMVPLSRAIRLSLLTT
jgi:hypothetical protein